MPKSPLRTGEYLIFRSTTIDSPDIFPLTWAARSDNLNHRIYFITPRNFVTYTPRRFIFAPEDQVVIDAFVCRLGANHAGGSPNGDAHRVDCGVGVGAGKRHLGLVPSTFSLHRNLDGNRG